MTISRRNLFLLGAATIVALACWLWPGSRSFRNLPPTATGAWIAFGDSLTEGYGAVRGSDFPAQLARSLGVTIENHGVSGETSAAGLKRLPDLEAAQPAVVFLCFGGNDVLQGVRREEMISNVGVMIDRLHGRGSFVVLLGIRGASLVGDRNASAFQKLAKEKRVLFVPNILDGVMGNAALMSDQVHPNEAGYGVIAAKIEDALKPVMEKLRR